MYVYICNLIINKVTKFNVLIDYICSVLIIYLRIKQPLTK